jgi:hypothetical protein
MQRLRYDLKLLFVAMSNICVLAWATVEMHSNENPVAIPLVAVFTSLSVVWYGGARVQHRIALGALGGFAGVAILTLCFFATHGIGYFFNPGAVDYFEDGAFTELVIFPPIGVVVWGGFGAIVGMVCGAIIWAIQYSVASMKR